MPNKKSKKGAKMVMSSKKMIDGVIHEVQEVLKHNPSLSSQKSKSKMDGKSSYTYDSESVNEQSQDTSMILNQSLNIGDQINTSAVMNDDSTKNSTRDSQRDRVKSQANLLTELQIEDASFNANTTPLKIQKSTEKKDSMIFDTNEKIKVVAQSTEDINDFDETKETQEQIKKEVDMITPRGQNDKKFEIPKSNESEKEHKEEQKQDDDDDLDFMFDQDAMRAAFNEIDEKEQKLKEEEEKLKQIQAQKEKNEKVKREAEERLEKERQRIAELKQKEEEQKRIQKFEKVLSSVKSELEKSEKLIENDKQHFTLDEHNVTDRIGHLDTQKQTFEKMINNGLQELGKVAKPSDQQTIQNLHKEKNAQIDYLQQQLQEAQDYRKQLKVEAEKRKADAAAKEAEKLAQEKAKLEAKKAEEQAERIRQQKEEEEKQAQLAEQQRQQELQKQREEEQKQQELKQKQEEAEQTKREREEAEEEMALHRSKQQDEMQRRKREEQERKDKQMIEQLKRMEEIQEQAKVKEQLKIKEMQIKVEQQKQQEVESQKEKDKLAQSQREEQEKKDRIQYTIMGLGAAILVGGVLLFKSRK